MFSCSDEFRSSSSRRRRRRRRRTTHREKDCLKNSVCVSLWPSVCVADYDAKKTMCSDSLEGCSRAAPTVAPNTPRRRRRGGREVMKSNRYFPFKVEAVGRCCRRTWGAFVLASWGVSNSSAAQLLHYSFVNTHRVYGPVRYGEVTLFVCFIRRSVFNHWTSLSVSLCLSLSLGLVVITPVKPEPEFDGSSQRDVCQKCIRGAQTWL